MASDDDDSVVSSTIATATATTIPPSYDSLKETSNVCSNQHSQTLSPSITSATAAVGDDGGMAIAALVALAAVADVQEPVYESSIHYEKVAYEANENDCAIGPSLLTDDGCSVVEDFVGGIAGDDNYEDIEEDGEENIEEEYDEEEEYEDNEEYGGEGEGELEEEQICSTKKENVNQEASSVNNLVAAALEKLDDENGEDVTRCICSMYHDDGFMISCERCSVWQHIACLDVDPDNVPDVYLCDECNPRNTLDVKAARVIQEKYLERMEMGSDEEEEEEVEPEPKRGVKRGGRGSKADSESKRRRGSAASTSTNQNSTAGSSGRKGSTSMANATSGAGKVKQRRMSVASVRDNGDIVGDEDASNAPPAKAMTREERKLAAYMAQFEKLEAKKVKVDVGERKSPPAAATVRPRSSAKEAGATQPKSRSRTNSVAAEGTRTPGRKPVVAGNVNSKGKKGKKLRTLAPQTKQLLEMHKQQQQAELQLQAPLTDLSTGDDDDCSGSNGVVRRRHRRVEEDHITSQPAFHDIISDAGVFSKSMLNLDGAVADFNPEPIVFREIHAQHVHVKSENLSQTLQFKPDGLVGKKALLLEYRASQEARLSHFQESGIGSGPGDVRIVPPRPFSSCNGSSFLSSRKRKGAKPSLPAALIPERQTVKYDKGGTVPQSPCTPISSNFKKEMMELFDADDDRRNIISMPSSPTVSTPPVVGHGTVLSPKDAKPNTTAESLTGESKLSTSAIRNTMVVPIPALPIDEPIVSAPTTPTKKKVSLSAFLKRRTSSGPITPTVTSTPQQVEKQAAENERDDTAAEAIEDRVTALLQGAGQAQVKTAVAAWPPPSVTEAPAECCDTNIAPLESSVVSSSVPSTITLLATADPLTRTTEQQHLPRPSPTQLVSPHLYVHESMPASNITPVISPSRPAPLQQSQQQQQQQWYLTDSNSFLEKSYVPAQGTKSAKQCTQDPNYSDARSSYIPGGPSSGGPLGSTYNHAQFLHQEWSEGNGNSTGELSWSRDNWASNQVASSRTDVRHSGQTFPEFDSTRTDAATDSRWCERNSETTSVKYSPRDADIIESRRDSSEVQPQNTCTSNEGDRLTNFSQGRRDQRHNSFEAQCEVSGGLRREAFSLIRDSGSEIRHTEFPSRGENEDARRDGYVSRDLDCDMRRDNFGATHEVGRDTVVSGVRNFSSREESRESYSSSREDRNNFSHVRDSGRDNFGSPREASGDSRRQFYSRDNYSNRRRENFNSARESDGELRHHGFNEYHDNRREPHDSNRRRGSHHVSGNTRRGGSHFRGNFRGGGHWRNDGVGRSNDRREGARRFERFDMGRSNPRDRINDRRDNGERRENRDMRSDSGESSAGRDAFGRDVSLRDKHNRSTQGEI